MPINPDSLRLELQDAQKRLTAIRKRRQQAEVDEKKVEDECQAYRVLLGIADPSSSSSDEDASDSSDASDASDANDSKVSKRSLIRKALSAAGVQGSTPAAIYKLVKAKGVTRNYVHSTLFKMKENGQAKELNGKYSAVPVQ